MPGPKPKLTRSKANKILIALRNDQTLKQACNVAGLSLGSYHRHIERYPDILKSIKKEFETQKAELRELAIESIRAAMKPKWQAAAWWLERNFPEEFGRASPRETQNHKEVIISHVDKDGNPTNGLPLHLIPYNERPHLPKSKGCVNDD